MSVVGKGKEKWREILSYLPPTNPFANNTIALMPPQSQALITWLLFICIVQNAMATNHYNWIKMCSLSHTLHLTRRSFNLGKVRMRSAPNFERKTWLSTQSTTNNPLAFLQHHHLHPTTQCKRITTHVAQIKTLQPPSNQFYIEEEIIKKSRFIGLSTPCNSWEEAQVHLEQVRKDHPKARHVCFAFVSGLEGVGTERCSDDGEPTGTAVSALICHLCLSVRGCSMMLVH